MRLHQTEPFAAGYQAITELDGKHSDMLMDFGILKLTPGMSFSDDKPLERIFVLLYGEIDVEYDGQIVHAVRPTYTNDTIWSINLPRDVSITVRGVAADSEVAVIRTANERIFPPTIRAGEDVVVEVRGKGFMNEAGTRIVRTAQDFRISPESNIMFGEDMHYPGKWSGFPSHSHAQPEIYFYKFYPENGFGLLRLGDEGVLLEHNDTVLIEPNLAHPQVAAPGYAMYYLWIIRHLEGNPYLGPDFDPQYLWVEQPGAKYWPDI
ncbi:MAG: 5-deoxy-glucuronate isomerase [Butyricicoccus sp.]